MAAADEVLAEIVSAILDGTPVDWKLVDCLTDSARPGAGQRAPDACACGRRPPQRS